MIISAGVDDSLLCRRDTPVDLIFFFPSLFLDLKRLVYLSRIVFDVQVCAPPLSSNPFCRKDVDPHLARTPLVTTSLSPSPPPPSLTLPLADEGRGSSSAPVVADSPLSLIPLSEDFFSLRPSRLDPVEDYFSFFCGLRDVPKRSAFFRFFHASNPPGGRDAQSPPSPSA